MIRKLLFVCAMLLCAVSSVLSQIQVGDAASPITHYNGKVGIGLGATIPAYSLDVNGTARFGAYALIGTGVAAGYYQDNANGAYRSLNVSGNTGYYFQSYNGATTPMFVGLQGTYAGRVGIGTTTPQQQLSIEGSSVSNIGLSVYNSINQGRLLLLNSGQGYVVTDQRNAGVIESYNDLILSAAVNPSNPNPSIKFQTGRSAYEGFTRMIIDNKGNVGIGTTDAISKLTVVGNSTSGDLYKRTSILLRNTNQTPGDGVSTWNLASYLAEAGNVRSIFEARNDNGYVHGAVGTSSNHDFIVFSNSAERIRITSNGNVGIGTNNPKAVFHASSASVKLNEIEQFSANLLIQGTCTNRSISEGAALGFVVPANTDGSNPWQQGRILVTPNNTATGNAEGKMYIQTRSWGNNTWIWQNNLVLKPNSFVGINTDDPKCQLDVAGTIRATEIKVEAATTSQLNVDGTIHAANIKVAANGQTADFVFEEAYDLKDLAEVEKYIKEHKHLPNIPSATDMEANGVDVAEMNKLLLQKVEELTLYVIDLENARSHDAESRTELEKTVLQQQNSLEELTKAIVEIKALLGAK
jgi:hypothetical protein